MVDFLDKVIDPYRLYSNKKKTREVYGISELFIKENTYDNTKKEIYHTGYILKGKNEYDILNKYVREPESKLSYLGDKYYKEDIGFKRFDDILYSDFKSNNKSLLIDNYLPKEEKYDILSRMFEGKPVLDKHKKHIKSIREFYREHMDMFFERAKFTANLKSELRYIKTVLKSFKISSSDRILDVGCGPGRLSIPLLKEGYNVFGIDLFESFIHIIAEQNESYKDRFTGGDILNSGYSKESFNCIFMMWHVVSELSHKLEDLFKEISKIISKDGILIFDVPDKDSDLTKKYYNSLENPQDYSEFLNRIPQLSILEEYLKKNGFTLRLSRRLKLGVHKFVFVCQKTN